jgi:hypothetical protein
MRVAEHNPDLVLPREKIERIILAEVAHEQEVAATIDEESLSDEVTAPLDVVIRDRVSRALEHVFTLLAVLLGSEAVRICFRALHQEDDRHRGTALEYLQTVLPSELRDAIWPSLGETGPLLSVRPAALVLQDLTKALAGENGVPSSKQDISSEAPITPLPREAAAPVSGEVRLSKVPPPVSEDG